MELRVAPRAHGDLPMRYHVGTEVDAWLAGAAPAEPVHAPDPLINFNHLGLAFDDADTCADGDTLLLELTVAELGVWRAAATVMRVSRVPIDERDDLTGQTHRIAVRFIALSEDAEEALRVYTERVRRGLAR